MLDMRRRGVADIAPKRRGVNVTMADARKAGGLQEDRAHKLSHIFTATVCANIATIGSGKARTPTPTSPRSTKTAC